jgi:hypothetical protein
MVHARGDGRDDDASERMLGAEPGVPAIGRDGIEDFNRRVQRPHGFRVRQPARERVFLTHSGRAEFSTSPLPDTSVPEGCLILGTMRSHDQWNTNVLCPVGD